MRRTPLIVGLAVVVIGGGIGAWVAARSRVPAPLDTFAACLREKNVTMYGTFWCPYCKTQKEIFGRSFRKAKYVECSLPGNPRAQAPACRDAKIEGYPTWIFGDGSRATGVLELEELAERSGCTLPESPANTP